MHGPEILARTLSTPIVDDQFGNRWQYHSRSDQHSKVACWALLFDLLLHCPLLVQHIAIGKVGFGINHEMHDFRTGRKKNLDLVLCTPGSGDVAKTTFAELASVYKVSLDSEELSSLASLPVLPRVSVGTVHVALEAKACMTAHIKALPRLYDELNSSHAAIHGSADFAIAAGYAIVNIADTFLSPGLNKADLKVAEPTITYHRQPRDAERTVAKLREIPRRTQPNAEGFDALGIVVVNMPNDGTRVTVFDEPPAPPTGDVLHYDQMIRRIASLYASKFGNV